VPEVVLNGHHTQYWISGSGEPLLWIMGTGMSGRAWHREQVPAFEQDYQCISYDMRGAGAADCPDEPYTPRVLAEDVIALLDELGLESAHMVGFSLGSCTIQELLIGWPDRVRSAVLLSTWGRTSDEYHIRRHYESRINALRHASTDVFRRFAFWMWSPTLVDEEHDRICELEEFLGTVTGSADVSGFIGHFAADLAHDAVDRLGGVTAPVLVLHGNEDLITLPRYNARVAKALPNATLEEVPRAGHLAYLEQPAAVNDAIRRFLRGAAAGSPA
jgi:3-oxoadipate enol-lactonase